MGPGNQRCTRNKKGLAMNRGKFAENYHVENKSVNYSTRDRVRGKKGK
jgi:hypothetical protein